MMNTTVAIVLPNWAVYLILVTCVFSLIENGLKIFNHFLGDWLARKRASDAAFAAYDSWKEHELAEEQSQQGSKP